MAETISPKSEKTHRMSAPWPIVGRLVLFLALAGFLTLACSISGLPTGSPPQPPPAVTDTRGVPTTTPTKIITDPLRGIWSGVAHSGEVALEIVIIINEPCTVGGICGWFELTTTACSGDFEYVNFSDGVYELRAVNKTPACGEGRDFFEPQPDGTLLYTSVGNYPETVGTLEKISASQEFAPIHVFYDDDGSPDGLTALLYLLLNPQVELKAVSISYGEAHPDIYIQNIARLLHGFDISGIPFGAGKDTPLSGDNAYPDWLRESSNDFWGFPLPDSGSFPVQAAAELMVSIANASPEPVTLFVSGSSTNLAQALRLDPDIRNNVEAVYMMGGAVFVPGNIRELILDSPNAVAEWNFYSDPLAAHEVFDSGLKIYLVPLDATNRVIFNNDDADKWRRGRGNISDFAADTIGWMVENWGFEDVYVWDLVTAVLMTNPGLCDFQPLHLDIITDEDPSQGQTLVVPGQAPNVMICLEPDAKRVKLTLIDVFSILR